MKHTYLLMTRNSCAGEHSFAQLYLFPLTFTAARTTTLQSQGNRALFRAISRIYAREAHAESVEEAADVEQPFHLSLIHI